VQLDDEARKVNTQLEASAAVLTPRVQAFYQLICDPRWDPLFEREDARGVRTSREDLLVRLKDWVDTDERSSALSAAFAGASCSMIAKTPPFEVAYGDENQAYDRGEDRYRAKNARMDSLEELFLVAGVGDAFMAAFGDQLTVYLPVDYRQNVNATDRLDLVQRAASIALPNQPRLLDPAFGEQLHKLIMTRYLAGNIAYGNLEFGQAVAECGVTVNQNLLQGNDPVFTDRSTTFHIRSTGTAGAVRTALDVVVRLEKPQPGEPVAAPGRIIHWREE
jgi:general secretion pathway protein K